MDLFDYMKETTNGKRVPPRIAHAPDNAGRGGWTGAHHRPGKLLYRAIKADKLGSVIFYGLREREKRRLPASSPTRQAQSLPS